MARDPTDPQEYVLVYDGESGLRMAPASARNDDFPEPHMDPDASLRLAPIAPDHAGPPPRRMSWGQILAGSAGAGLLAVVIAVALRTPQTPPPDVPVETGPRMKVVVAPDRPIPAAPAVSPSQRLEVLSPATLAAAPTSPPRLSVQPAAEIPRLAVAPPAPRQIRPPAPSPEIAPAMPTGSADRLAARCAAPRSQAEDIVCADPELLAADRRMARAFRAAARSGVSLQQLRDEQGDWLDIREDAARRSPRAVAQIYDQRIDELEAMAADDTPDR